MWAKTNNPYLHAGKDIRLYIFPLSGVGWEQY